VDPFDSDGDGTSDAEEIAIGTDPYDSSNGGASGGGGRKDDKDEDHLCGLLGLEVLLLVALRRRRSSLDHAR
jgi:MYXO-CTERM domain-containing protein